MRSTRVAELEATDAEMDHPGGTRLGDRMAGFASMLAVHRSRRGRGSASGGGGRDVGDKALLEDRELREVEETYREGISAVQIVEIFASRGLRFSEATFRKYVQQGLLPRSRRVGRKGKHRGSMGVYPAKTVRRINAIKRLMADGYTIEEIQEQFLRYTDVIETLEEGLGEIFGRFEGELSSPRFDDKARRSLKKEIREAQKTADELMRRIGGLSERVSQPREDSYRGGGAAGSAEDLL
jgi:DNA-binding transcriptional MerR regulator